MTSTRQELLEAQTSPPPVEDPRVSIGLPVYNGEPFLREAIESILKQDFTDFELIICDNASTDATQEICRELQERDGRIRYHRVPQNRGAAWNFNRCVELARGPYFKWMAHDDLHLPSYLSRCVDVLDRDPSVVLCHSRAVDIDEAGDVLYTWEAPGAGDHPDPVERFRRFVYQRSGFFEAFGLVRIEQLRRTPLIGPYSGSDVTLLADLALRGRFHEIDQPLFLHREHPGRSVRAHADPKTRSEWFDPSGTPRWSLSTWRMASKLAQVVAVTPAPGRGQVRCLGVLAGWCWRVRRKLARELARAVLGAGRLRSVEGAPPEQPREQQVTPVQLDGPSNAVTPLEREDLSVIIIARNAGSTLPAVLEGLSGQSISGHWDVVVCDHGSTDDTHMLALGWRHRLPGLQVIHVAGEQPGSVARRRAVQAATGGIVVLLSPDQVPDGHWLAQLARAARTADVVIGAWTDPIAEGLAEHPEVHGRAALCLWAREPAIAVRRAALAPADERAVDGLDDTGLVCIDGVRVVQAPSAHVRAVTSPPLSRLATQQYRVGVREGQLLRQAGEGAAARPRGAGAGEARSRGSSIRDRRGRRASVALLARLLGRRVGARAADRKRR